MLRIKGFKWDTWNTGHIARHRVRPEEAEEVFFNEPLFRKGRSGTYMALGPTDDGRLLTVIYAVRPGGEVYVVTARDMDHKERRLYRRERRR
ncbi:MAG: BrnT family toxin [Thermanaeromonas sp.]|uniref:BrnT family toxin n=1 Tax=Thermanaeromonas sp. TaxID=2003697 RepID=UPI002438EA2F|nr:BrnT family toxin [Thermanaeromonas sp.]MCG0277750.1 BrnT family toxin [Thermanaeromonas sp.]